MDLEIDDEDAKFCSACLTVDVKMFLLQETNLLEVFESIIRNSEMKSPCIPHYMCYTCLALLRKCADFHKMCCEAQQVLNVWPANCISTTRRKLIKKPLNFITSEIEQVSYIPEDEDTVIATEIKIECPMEFHQERQSDDFDTHFDTACPESPVDIKMFDEKVQTGQLHQIKVKDDPALCESDLDEPLAALKTGLLRKALEKPKKKIVLKKTVKKSTKSTENKKVQKQMKPVVKKKAKYNVKSEKDFEEFCKLHNVDVVFLTKEQQIERMKVKYQDNKYRKRCELCFAGFMTDTAYEKHVKCHDPSFGSFVCEVCQLRYKEKVAWQTHVRQHKKEFICKLCSKTLANSYLAMQHHRWHEGVKHECKHCKKKFNAVSTHLNHVREQHTLARCPECGDSFEGTVRLKRHRDSAHCECKECHVVFRNSGALERHLEAGCRPELLPCKKCGVSFPDAQSQALHAQRTDCGTRYKCEACPSTFWSDRARGNHWASVHMGHQIKSHRGKPGQPGDTHCATETEDGSGDVDTRSYLCELCAKSFKNLMNLKRHHSKVHLDDRPFKCHHCAKAFTDKCKLAVHINTHTGDRPFQCKQCPERFKSYSQRYKHRLLVHEKERKYKCSQCPKDYVVLYDLKEHIKYSHLHLPRPSRKNPRAAKNIVQERMLGLL